MKLYCCMSKVGVRYAKKDKPESVMFPETETLMIYGAGFVLS